VEAACRAPAKGYK